MTLWAALAQPLTEWPSTRTEKTSQMHPAQPCAAQRVVKMPGVAQQVQDYLASVRPQLEEVLLERSFAMPGAFFRKRKRGLQTEIEVYHATSDEIFYPVNEALELLKIPLVLEPTGIDNTVSFADLVGRQDPLGEDGSARCKLPIEVKGEWQECHEGKHFANLLCGTEKERERVLDVCAQTLGHTVANGARYALIISNRWLVVLRRNEDVKVSTTAFSKCFDITCSNPTIRQLLLWAAVQASSSQWLDPRARPATPEEEKWLAKVIKRANASTGGADSNSSDDNSGDDKGPGAGAGSGSGSAGGRRPAAGSSQQSAAKRRNRGTRRAGGSGVSSKLQRWLRTLPEAPFSQLGLGQVLMRMPTRMVRRGILGGQTAIFKLWDILEGPEVATEMQLELQVYERLRSLQGCSVPKLLAAGTTLGGAVGFLTLSDCGEEVSDDSPLSQELRLAMTKAIQAVHACHVWHGDVQPRNFLHSRETGRVVLADFSAAQLLGPEQSPDDELNHSLRYLA